MILVRKLLFFLSQEIFPPSPSNQYPPRGEYMCIYRCACKSLYTYTYPYPFSLLDDIYVSITYVFSICMYILYVFSICMYYTSM